MTKPPIHLRSLVFDSLEQQIAVIDSRGIIVDVNRAWIDFGIENTMPSGHSWIGTSYLKSLHSAIAADEPMAEEALQGILEVIQGEQELFAMEYPCHSPTEKRWFIMQICKLADVHQGLYVISHHNITQRKLAEERVQHLATHDSLTGLANRRHLDQVLKTEIRRSARAHTPLSLLMMDVDHFKQYNDTHGHPEGDEVLKKIASILRSSGRRPTDVAARLGGDEFILLLVDSDVDGSQHIANELVQAVSALDLSAGSAGKLSVSIGLVTTLPEAGMSADTLLEDVDKALYHAKNAGRDRVEHVLQGDLQDIWPAQIRQSAR